MGALRLRFHDIPDDRMEKSERKLSLLVHRNMFVLHLDVLYGVGYFPFCVLEGENIETNISRSHPYLPSTLILNTV